MARFLPWIIFALLCLPLADLLSAFWLARQIGWWTALWLIAAAVLGFTILKNWRAATAWAVVGSLRDGSAPFRRMFWVARSLVAALLLIFPGALSDLMALVLLLPWPSPSDNLPPRPNDQVIEGEFVRVEPAQVEPPRLEDSQRHSG
ncbi:FxsA family protein [Chitinimonas lacunae]|uniref:FxsA family protein n=1 Tax=Chitinimonas lacunae TaxID=1963018 RepID=A0ABV8MUP4_9NEIS